LLYELAALSGLYALAAVLSAIPMISGLLDDSMEIKFDRPNPAIVADNGNGLPPPQRGASTTSRTASEITPWILLTAADVSDRNCTKLSGT
jgi:hypothetical protein